MRLGKMCELYDNWSNRIIVKPFSQLTSDRHPGRIDAKADIGGSDRTNERERSN
jgi:hypothetical protein